MADPKPAEPAASNNLIANLARSGRMRIAAALIVTALVGGGLGVIMLRGESGGQKLLFSGLDLQEAAEITNKLDTANIKYALEGGGSAIFVDGAKVDQARMMLSEQGLPTHGSIGWEIFDKNDSLGETQFVLNIKKLRAMEGELERTISSYDMVQSAKVHLSVPDKPLFQQGNDKPKASVVVKITGNMMSAEKVRAIRTLVAAQVPGLDLNSVSVSSTDGRLLAAPIDSDDPTGASGGASTDERRQAMEDAYRKKVLEVIESIAGPGAARVTVSMDVDFNKVTQSSEEYNPDSKVVRSQTTVEDNSNSAEAAPGDETSVAKNIPTGATPPAPTQPKNQTSTGHNEETTNYEISKTLRTEVNEGGKINRVSVAVAIDQERVPGEEGKPATYKARSPEELERIKDLVKSAVLFNEARGDVVTVAPVAFARPDISLDGAKPPGPFDFDKFDLVHAGEIGALLITALALVFFVLRPLVGGLFARPEPENLPPEIQALKGAKRAKAIAQFQIQQMQGIQAGGDGGGVTVQVTDQRTVPVPEGKTVTFDMPTPERLDAGIDVARISGQVKASSIKKISEVVTNYPDESISIIRSWMAEEPSAV
ncbi:MAG TPA: flagellar basal-body MS-ring/collar protein FliF [Hyphomonadaceae bacterium]|nr:flagellar basal-body MS-ring/collar protein FliF [Hyphomonadaceae bacterium]